MPKIRTPLRDDISTKYLFVKTSDWEARCIVCKGNKTYCRSNHITRHYNTYHRNIYGKWSERDRQKLIKSYKTQVERKAKEKEKRREKKERERKEDQNETPCTSFISINEEEPMFLDSDDEPVFSEDPLAGTVDLSTKMTVNNQPALAASYAIAWEIAKKRRNFSDGEFIKDCALALATAFNNGSAIDQFKTVSLSSTAISHRINRINNFLERKLHLLIQDSAYFSLCLNETINLDDTNHLVIFIRIVGRDFAIHEDLFFIHSMSKTTENNDTCNGVIREVQKYASFGKCSCIITNGTPIMTDICDSLINILQKDNIKCPVLHFNNYILSEEVLCLKLQLMSVMNLVVTVINIIKRETISASQSKFDLFWNEINVIYNDLILDSEIHWSNIGACLKRFFAIRKQCLEFLKTIKQDTTEIQKSLQDYKFLCKLAFLTDVTSHLYKLNLKLQNPKSLNLVNLVKCIITFYHKFEMLQEEIKRNQFVNFQCCALIQIEYLEADFTHFHKNLSVVLDDFKTCFTTFDLLKSGFELFTSPLTANITRQDPELQPELRDLRSNVYYASRQENCEDFFKLLPTDRFPKLHDFGLKMHSMFSSTNTCEKLSPILKQIKSTYSRSLTNASLFALLRIATTTVSLDIVNIVNHKIKAN